MFSICSSLLEKETMGPCNFTPEVYRALYLSCGYDISLVYAYS